jgi:ubiquinone/menaquinone biosynthesis C-methylase UbiE
MKRRHRAAGDAPHQAPRTPPPTDQHAAQRGWSHVAQWYDALAGDEGSEYQREVIFPKLWQRIDQSVTGRNRSKRTLLDIACGQGAWCRYAIEQGWEARGVDIAASLVDAAVQRETDSPIGARYQVADATNLPEDDPFLPDHHFDVVTVILAIQNIDRLSPLWRRVSRLLRDGGLLAVVMMHPCFRVPKQSGWSWDDEHGIQLRTIASYLGSQTIEIEMAPGEAARGKRSATTRHYHRPLQAYINTLGSAGLPIEAIDEWPSHKWSQPGPRQQELNRSRREIPMFLSLLARRVPKPS